MLVKLHHRRDFMAKFERHEPVMQDSTMMKELMECPRKFFYRIVLGRVPRTSRYQIVFDFGSAYHKFREILEDTFQKTGSADDAYKAAMAYVLSVNLPEDSSPYAKFSYLTNIRLIKTCQIAYDYWEKEKKLGRFKVLGIEQPINVQLPDGNYTSGRVDQIVDWSGQIWDRDWKTSSKDEKMFSAGVEPNDQATRYIYMLEKLHGKSVGGVIFEVIYQTKTVEPKIFVVPTQRTAAQLQHWETEQIMLNKILDMYRDQDFWPMHVFKTNCAWCDYAMVCRRPNEKSMMAVLEENYACKPWNHENVEQAEIG